jgi:hypothetical protein
VAGRWRIAPYADGCITAPARGRFVVPQAFDRPPPGEGAPVAVDPDGGGLTAVSCPPAASCVAVDFDGRALALPS